MYDKRSIQRLLVEICRTIRLKIQVEFTFYRHLKKCLLVQGYKETKKLKLYYYTFAAMGDKHHNLAFSVISRINWHYNPNAPLKDPKILIKDEYDHNLNYDDNYRDLTDEELNAVISEKYPIRLYDASFDQRAWPEEFEKTIDFVKWSIQLKPKSTIRDILKVVKRMPFYGYWECKPPTLQILKHGYNPWEEPVYVMPFRFGT